MILDEENIINLKFTYPSGPEPETLEEMTICSLIETVDDLRDKLETGNLWKSRPLDKDNFYGEGLFVRCQDGYMTSGFCDHRIWWVYDHKRGECHPEDPDNKVTHYCYRPTNRPWA